MRTNGQTSDVALRTRWYVRMRWFLLLAVGLPGILSQLISSGWSDTMLHDIALGCLALASNLFFFLLARHHTKNAAYYRWIGLILIFFDICLVTAVLFIKGGIESRSVILYTVPILMAAAIWGRLLTYGAALFAASCYAALIIGEYIDVLQPQGIVAPQLHDNGEYVLESSLFFIAILLLIGVSVDFFSRLLQEKERQASKNLSALQSAQAIAKLGSWEWDTKTKQLLWSDELYHLLGISDTKHVPSHETYLSRVHPDDRVLVQSQIERMLHTPKPFNYNHRIVLPSGVVHYLHSEGQLIYDKRHHVSKVIGTVQDVSEARELDQAKSDFVALASHQLRTPATGVKQYLGMVLDGFSGILNSDQQRMLQTAYDSNERQLATVDDLLRVAQVESGKLPHRTQNTDLVYLLHTIAAEQATTHERTITFQSRNKSLWYPVDKRRFRMAVDNLVDNANKYAPGKSPIRLTLSRRHDSIYIRVIDTGIGIAQADMPRLFRKFSRIDSPLSRQVGGTGLGLYWSAKLVRLHGGIIEVESTPSKGSTFCIKLPFPAPEPKKPSKRSPK